jgi:DNA polymerase/3'-5' exonuclease PolX
LKLDLAKSIADRLKSELEPFCDRIEIAGSIRRQKPEVKDIELVAIPKRISVPDLFGESLQIHPGFIAAVNQYQAVKGTPEGRYTQRKIPDGICLDLFIAHQDNWGLILAIRTGSAEYSHRVLACGWTQKGYTSVNGMLIKYGQQMPVREEKDLFDIIGIPFQAPENRSL